MKWKQPLRLRREWKGSNCWMEASVWEQNLDSGNIKKPMVTCCAYEVAQMKTSLKRRNVPRGIAYTSRSLDSYDGRVVEFRLHEECVPWTPGDQPRFPPSTAMRKDVLIPNTSAMDNMSRAESTASMASFVRSALSLLLTNTWNIPEEERRCSGSYLAERGLFRWL